MGYRDNSATSKVFLDGQAAGREGVPVTACPFKSDGPKKAAWLLGWKEGSERAFPKQITEKEWLRRVGKETLPHPDHFCNHWDADKCACLGACGCHYHGVLKKERIGLIKMDHISTYHAVMYPERVDYLRRNWGFLVHGRLKNEIWDFDSRFCEGCEKALAEGKPAFKQGEYLTVDELRAAITAGRRCYFDNPEGENYGPSSHRKWRYPFSTGIPFRQKNEAL